MLRKGLAFRLSWVVAGLATFGLAVPVCILRSVKQRGSETAPLAFDVRPVGASLELIHRTHQVRSSDDHLSQSDTEQKSSAMRHDYDSTSDQSAGVTPTQIPQGLRTSPSSDSLLVTDARQIRATMQTDGAAVPTGFVQGSGGDVGRPVPGMTTVRMQDEESGGAEEAGEASSGLSLLTIGAGVLAAAGVTAATLAIIEANNDPASP